VAATWPVTLQQLVNEEGFAYTVGETAIRTESDVGPAKVRRRFTKSVDSVSVTINITQDLYPTFRDFHDITLNGGVLPFDFENPLTGTLEEFRFSGPYQIRSIGAGNFIVSMVWERLP
jgi:hypothetical protein